MSIKHTTGRLEEIDILRGVGILLMVFGHVGFGEGFHRFIHAFHMPLFYFVSGYFFHPREKVPQQYIIGKAKRRLLPYALFSMLRSSFCGITPEVLRSSKAYVGFAGGCPRSEEIPLSTCV